MTPSRRSHLDGLAIALLVGCCFLWGLNQVAVKVILAEMPGLQQAAVRSLGSVLLVWAWARWRGIALFERDGSLPGGLLAGMLFAAEFGCIFAGLQFTTASRMAVFIYLSPFIVALGMPFIARGERLNRLQLAGLVVAFAGVAWAFAEGFTAPVDPAATPLQWVGDSLGVIAAVLWGATTLSIRGSRLGSVAPEKALFYQLGISGLALTAAAALAPAPWPTRLSVLAWGSVAFQTVVIAFASYLTWFWLMRHYPATRLAVFTLLTPVFGLLLGAWLLGEPVTLRLVVALAAVAAGIVLVNRR